MIGHVAEILLEQLRRRRDGGMRKIGNSVHGQRDDVSRASLRDSFEHSLLVVAAGAVTRNQQWIVVVRVVRTATSGASESVASFLENRQRRRMSLVGRVCKTQRLGDIVAPACVLYVR